MELRKDDELLLKFFWTSTRFSSNIQTNRTQAGCNVNQSSSSSEITRESVINNEQCERGVFDPKIKSSSHESGIPIQLMEI